MAENAHVLLETLFVLNLEIHRAYFVLTSIDYGIFI